jgi:hypothetical protein
MSACAPLNSTVRLHVTVAAPFKVVLAARLLWLLWIVSAAYVGWDLYSRTRPSPPLEVCCWLAWFVFAGFVIRDIARGSNLLRVVCCLFCAACGALFAFGAQTIMVNSVEPSKLIEALLLWMLVLIYFVIILLLLHGDSSPWFKKHKVMQPNTSLERTREG